MLWKLLMMTGCTLLTYAQPYDLLIRGGRVIDPKNGLDAVADVAIAGGKIARVAASIPAAEAKRVVDAAGLVVVPGLIDIHVHLYPGQGGKGAYSNLGVPPDAFSFRSGVTTMVDAGTAGWRNFADFRQRVIDRAQTRVLAFVNIYGPGMGDWPETDPAEMQPERAAAVARENPGIVVGFKTAHYSGPGWPSVEAAVKAGEIAHMPVMVDFGWLDDPQSNIKRLFLEKLRPGDIVTTLSGKTVEILNTDAEGRLILADALTYAQRLGCTHLVDAATLTGAIVVALGYVHVGLFAADDALAGQVMSAAAAEGEKMWRMPLDDDYKEVLKSTFADLPNVGNRWGGAITAALFLKEFVDTTPWVHLDIAGTAWLEEGKPFSAKGPTGVPVRTLARLALDWAR